MSANKKDEKKEAPSNPYGLLTESFDGIHRLRPITQQNQNMTPQSQPAAEPEKSDGGNKK